MLAYDKGEEAVHRKIHPFPFCNFSIHTCALTSDSGLCSEAHSFWLIETGDTNSRMTVTHVTPHSVQSYPGGVKALWFCKRVCKAAGGLWDYRPSNIAHKHLCFLFADKNKYELIIIKKNISTVSHIHVKHGGSIMNVLSVFYCPANQVACCSEGLCDCLQVEAGGQREGGWWNFRSPFGHAV